jgi:hypothetical protein
LSTTSAAWQRSNGSQPPETDSVRSVRKQAPGGPRRCRISRAHQEVGPPPLGDA